MGNFGHLTGTWYVSFYLFICAETRFNKESIKSSYRPTRQNFIIFRFRSALSRLLYLPHININDTSLMFWKLDVRCFLFNPDSEVKSDSKHCLPADDCLPNHNLTDVCDPMVLISVDSLWKYDIVLAMFPALDIFPTKASITSISSICTTRLR